MQLFDTHAHLNDECFNNTLHQVLEEARSAGLVGIAVIGYDVQSSGRAVDLAQQHPGYLHAVVGVQPNSVAKSGPDDFDEIVRLAQQPGVVGIGETGLDCYWDDTPLEDQQRMFDRHIDLCLDLNRPMIIHMRESCDLIIEQLRRRDRLPAGVMHSFTGTVQQCQQCLDLGLMISFAGMVTFKKNDSLREVAAMVPADRLLIETDAPYLSPEPLRGRRPNVPDRVAHTLQKLAEVRGTYANGLAQQTTQNAIQFYNLPAFRR